MTRLDGEKKSPLPWIIGLIVLALLAAAIYYFAVANKGVDQAVINGDGVELQNTAPGGLGVNGDADDVAENAVVVPPVATDNTMKLPDNTIVDGNSAGMDNSAMMNNNSVGMDNSAMTDSNSAGMDNSAMANPAMATPMPAITPASATSNGDSNDTLATRSKTIRNDDKTVIYKKSVKEDGALMRDKKIVPEPVQKAKKMQ